MNIVPAVGLVAVLATSACATTPAMPPAHKIPGIEYNYWEEQDYTNTIFKVFGGDFSHYSLLFSNLIDNFLKGGKQDNSEISDYLHSLADRVREQTPQSVTLMGNREIGSYYAIFGDSQDNYHFILGFDSDGNVKSVIASDRKGGSFEVSTLKSTVNYTPHAFFAINDGGSAELAIPADLPSRFASIGSALRADLHGLALVNRQTPLPFGFVTKELAKKPEGQNDSSSYSAQYSVQPTAEVIRTADAYLDIEKTRYKLKTKIRKEGGDEDLIVCGDFPSTLTLKAIRIVADAYLKEHGETFLSANILSGQLLVRTAEGNVYDFGQMRYRNEYGKGNVQCAAYLFDKSKVQPLQMK